MDVCLINNKACKFNSSFKLAKAIFTLFNKFGLYVPIVKNSSNETYLEYSGEGGSKLKIWVSKNRISYMLNGHLKSIPKERLYFVIKELSRYMTNDNSC